MAVMKDILIRDAVEGDARALAEVCVMAGHGVMELFYEGLVPGKSVLDCVMARRILDRDSFATFRRWRVATDGGAILGDEHPAAQALIRARRSVRTEAKMRPIAALWSSRKFRWQLLREYHRGLPQHVERGGCALMARREHLARVQKFPA